MQPASTEGRWIEHRAVQELSHVLRRPVWQDLFQVQAFDGFSRRRRSARQQKCLGPAEHQGRPYPLQGGPALFGGQTVMALVRAAGLVQARGNARLDHLSQGPQCGLAPPVVDHPVEIERPLRKAPEIARLDRRDEALDIGDQFFSGVPSDLSLVERRHQNDCGREVWRRLGQDLVVEDSA